MSRDPYLVLDEIREHGSLILLWINDVRYEDFIVDRKGYDAVLHNIQNVGELVKRLPADLRRRYPEVPWREIAGFRDVIVHDYAGLDPRIVWAVAQHEVPLLLQIVEDILRDVQGFEAR